MLLTRIRPVLPYVGLMAVVLAAYANHFGNGFHFDDRHTIVENQAIQSLANIPRFFADAKTFSTLNNAWLWRPMTSTSLAIDYWLGGGLKPFWFHFSTFVSFLVLLVLMVFLFRRIMDLADPHPSNRWTAFAAAAIYGLHPAGAETVNYIIQRADMYNTLGVVASLLWFIANPEQRKRGWYLLPAVAAYLFKAPALIFPLILIAYLFLFEQKADSKQWGVSIRAALPALAVTAVVAYATMWMTPSTYQLGPGVEKSLYRLTQPWIAAHYFRSFFVPTSLAIDQYWPFVSSAFSPRALAGDAFVYGAAPGNAAHRVWDSVVFPGALTHFARSPDRSGQRPSHVLRLRRFGAGGGVGRKASGLPVLQPASSASGSRGSVPSSRRRSGRRARPQQRLAHQ